jgi:hypothetical protein
VRLLPQLYRLWPRIETLMFLQGLLIGVGAFGLYGLATERAGSPVLGLALAASYLLHPAILSTASNDLREITLGIGPALLALWLHATRRFVAFAAAALVALSARSEYAVLVAAIGVMNVRLLPAASRRIAFMLPVGLAVGWAALAEAYYRAHYATHWPLLGFAGSEPMATTAVRFAARLPQFFEMMLLPGALALAAPEALAVAMPFVALAKRVQALQFPPHHLQHLAPAMVATFWAFALALTALWARLAPRRRNAAVAGLALAALASFAYFAARAATAYPREREASGRLARWADRLPADATVVVPGSLAARFSAHTRVLDYENLPIGSDHATPAERDAALERVLASADLVATLDAPGVVARVVATGLFEKGRAFRRYTFFVRRADAQRVEHPDAVLQRALLWDALPDWKRRGATLALPK